MTEHAAAPAALTVPDPSVVVLVGMSGCGKSTFAARHFAATEVVSSDGCRALIADDPSDQSATGDAFDLLSFLLHKRLKRGRLTVVDATSLTRDARRRYLGLAAKHGVPPVAVVFDLPVEVCLERDARRVDRRVGRAVIEQQRAALQRGLEQLTGEPWRVLRILSTPEEVAAVTVAREPWPWAPPDAG